MVNEKEHGIGQFIWNDGYAYEGQFELGVMQGHGIYGYAPSEANKLKNNKYQQKNTIQTYKGDFLKNRFHGKGFLI